jgi:hypothetical protein
MTSPSARDTDSAILSYVTPPQYTLVKISTVGGEPVDRGRDTKLLLQHKTVKKLPVRLYLHSA